MTLLGLSGRSLARALLLAGLLLVGRFALATHAYEHDLAIACNGCELCELSQASGDSFVVGATLEALWLVTEPPASPAVALPPVSRVRTPPTRAPPRFLV
jgi:hypothetical protein